MSNPFETLGKALQDLTKAIDKSAEERRAEWKLQSQKVIAFVAQNPLDGMPDDVVEDMRTAVADSLLKLATEMEAGRRVIGLHMVAITDTGESYQAIAAASAALPHLSVAVSQQAKNLTLKTGKEMDTWEEPEDECTCPACQFARAMAPHSPIQ